MALLIVITFSSTSKLNFVTDFWMWKFPGISKSQPFVSLFNLPTVANGLVKNSKLVANAVADGWDLKRSQ
jgi:hypothetical protein